MKLLYTLIILSAFFISCSTEPEVVHGCLDSTACNYNSSTTLECENCCEYEETIYVEECSWQYVCGYETISLGADSYCSDGCSNVLGQYCTNNGDCYSGSNLILGCDSGATCTRYENQYICADEYVCVDDYVTSCP